MHRNNKEIDQEINEESRPEAGTRERDKVLKTYTPEAVREAKADEGACKRAMHVQAGTSMDNMPQANSGCGCDDALEEHEEHESEAEKKVENE